MPGPAPGPQEPEKKKKPLWRLWNGKAKDAKVSIDRIRAVNAISDDDSARAYLKADLPRLKQRAALLNSAIFLSVGAAICTTVLVILAFLSAFFGLRHEPGEALMFVVALGLMATSLVFLAREVWIALTDYDHHS